MFCSNCGSQIKEGVKFCPICGKQIQAASTVNAAAPPEKAIENGSAQPAPAVNPAPEVPPAPSPENGGEGGKKKKIPLPVIFAAGGAVLLAVILILVFAVIVPAVKKRGNNTTPAVQDIVVPAGEAVFSGQDLGISFLYPEDALIVDRGEKGVYVYPTGVRELPSVLITVQGKEASPESYYKKYLKELKKNYTEVEDSEIQRADVPDREVYLVRAEVNDRGTWHVVDRFMESSDGKTVEYTVESEKAGEADPLVLGIIRSLAADADAYEGAVIETKAAAATTEAPAETETDSPETTTEATEPETTEEETTTEATEEETTEEPPASEVTYTEYENESSKIRISLPDIVEVQDIEVGCAGISDDLVIMAYYAGSYYDDDERSFLIYGADDAMNLANKDISVLETLVLADSITVNSFDMAELAGLSGYVMDVDLEMEAIKGRGKLYVLDLENQPGAYFVYYIVSENAKDAKTLQKIGQESIDSFTMSGEPEIPDFSIYFSDNDSFCFFVESDMVESSEAVEDMVTLTVSEETVGSSGQIVVKKNDYRENGITTLDEFVSQYCEVVGLTEEESAPEDFVWDTRYHFRYLFADYTDDDGTEMAMYLCACADDDGYIYTILTEEEGNAVSDIADVIDYILLSFYIVE